MIPSFEQLKPLRRIFADDITGNSFVIEMAFLQSNLCWAGDRKTRQTSQISSMKLFDNKWKLSFFPVESVIQTKHENIYCQFIII